eukprot:COSAG01_NODE_5299_length_4352_cov_2.254879_6_plen_273_part_00
MVMAAAAAQQDQQPQPQPQPQPEWAARRGPQLAQIPRQLWPSLEAKLGGAPGREVFDAGLHFTMDWDESAGWRMYVTGEGGVVASHAAALSPSESSAPAADAAAAATAAAAPELWLVDHAWTYTPASAQTTLSNHPGLLERVLGLLDMEDEDEAQASEEELREEVEDTEAQEAQQQRGGVAKNTGPAPTAPSEAEIEAACRIEASTIPGAGQGAFTGVALPAGARVRRTHGAHTRDDGSTHAYPIVMCVFGSGLRRTGRRTTRRWASTKASV